MKNFRLDNLETEGEEKEKSAIIFSFFKYDRSSSLKSDKTFCGCNDYHCECDSICTCDVHDPCSCDSECSYCYCDHNCTCDDDNSCSCYMD